MTPVDDQRHWTLKGTNVGSPDVRCDFCDLCHGARSVRIDYRGSDHPKVMFVGEAPGEKEDEKGKPFVGPSGEILDRMISDADIPEDEVLFMNVVRCRPPDNRDPTKEEIQICSAYLWHDIRRFDPDVIVPLGNVALSVFGVTDKRITRASREVFKKSIGGKERVIIPTVHPAAVLRAGGTLYATSVEDLRFAYRNGRRRPFPWWSVLNDTERAIDYIRGVIRKYEDREIGWVAYDIETVGLDGGRKTDRHGNPTEFLGFALAYKRGHGVFIPVSHPQSDVDPSKILPHLREMLCKVPLVAHNAMFDVTFTRSFYGWDDEFRVADDVLLMSFILYAGRRSHALNTCASEDLGSGQWKSMVLGYLERHYPRLRDRHYGNVYLDLLGRYACYDAEATLCLRDLYFKMIGKSGLGPAYKRWMRAFRVFSEIERRGAFLDLDFLGEKEKKYLEEQEEIVRLLYKFPELEMFEEEEGKPFKPGNYGHVRRVLFHRDGFGLLGRVIKEIRSRPKVKLIESRLSRRIDLGSKRDRKMLLRANVSVPIEYTAKGRESGKELWESVSTGDGVVRDLYVWCLDQDLWNLKDAARFIDLVRTWKKIDKIRTAFFKPFRASCRNGTYNTTLSYDLWSQTGRFRAQVHTAPKKSDVRRCYVSEWYQSGGVLLMADYCLAAGIPVVTEYGLMPIEQVVEDCPAVLSSPDGVAAVFQPVEKGLCIGEVDLYEVFLGDGSSVRCTSDHTWMGHDGQMVKTSELREGFKLSYVRERTSGHYRYWLKVVAVARAGRGLAYQITVAETHTYVLGNGLVSGNSQIELRIMACCSGDEAMLKAFHDGKDIHRETAAVVFHRPPDQITDQQRDFSKAQPLSVSILTPTGWTAMGSLKVGDEIIGANGYPTRVAGVYPQGRKVVYRVTLSDGSSTRCCGDHLWLVQDSSSGHCDRGWSVMSLDEIVKSGLRTRRGDSKFFLPLVEPVEFVEQDLSLDPYLVGVLLGGGGLTTGAVKVSSADDEVLDSVRALLPPGLELCHDEHVDWVVTSRRAGFHTSHLNESLRGLGMWGKYSWEKEVPEQYLFSSIKYRLLLLQGLMDTDGAVELGGASFTSASKALASAVVFLARSFGGRASLNSFSICGRLAWRVHLTLPSSVNPFRLRRKAVAYRPLNLPTRKIVAVDEIGIDEVQCIRVEAEDQLYVTDDVIVTHNTVNFGVLYGRGANAVTEATGMKFEEAKALVDSYFERFPSVKSWIDAQHEYAKENGFVEIPTGRIRFLPMATDVCGCDRYGCQRCAKKAEAMRESQNCVDAETDILTDRGWKRYDGVEEGTVVLTKNPETGVLEWNTIDQLCVFPQSSGDLIQFESKTFSAVTTTDHRWLIYNNSTGKDEIRLSSEISVWGHHRIHRTGSYPDETCEHDDDTVDLVGWFLTDASMRKANDKCRWKVYLCQSYRANRAKAEKIDSLVRRVGCLQSVELDDLTQCAKWNLDRETSTWLAETFPDRHLTYEFILELDRSSARRLVEVMLDGDGTREPSRSRFYCQHEDQADLFQVLCVIAGYATTKIYQDMSMYEPRSDKLLNVPKSEGCWTVAILRRDKIQLARHQRRVLKNDGRLVWCPQVKNQTFVARRDGKVYITGNTPIQAAASDICLESLLEIQDRFINSGMKSRCWLFHHDAISVDVFPGELPAAHAIMHGVMLTHPQKVFPWLTVPMSIDMTLGARWDGSCKMESLSSEDSGEVIIRVSGKLPYVRELVYRLGLQGLRGGFVPSIEVRFEVLEETEDRPLSKEDVVFRKHHVGDTGGNASCVAQVRYEVLSGDR